MIVAFFRRRAPTATVRANASDVRGFFEAPDVRCDSSRAPVIACFLRWSFTASTVRASAGEAFPLPSIIPFRWDFSSAAVTASFFCCRCTARALRASAAEARGRAAESRVAAALEREGWAILARRVRTEAGELDLIAERQGLLAFVEVKARPRLAEAAEAVSPRQRARLMAAAEAWLAANPGRGAAGMRFDVMLVGGDGAVRRIADAFRLGD